MIVVYVGHGVSQGISGMEKFMCSIEKRMYKTLNEYNTFFILLLLLIIQRAQEQSCIEDP